MAAPIPGPAFKLLQGSTPVTVEHAPEISPAPVEPATVPQVPALPWDVLRPSGSAAVAPNSGPQSPHLFEDLCALVTPDSLNAIKGDQPFSKHSKIHMPFSKHSKICPT